MDGRMRERRFLPLGQCLRPLRRASRRAGSASADPPPRQFRPGGPRLVAFAGELLPARCFALEMVAAAQKPDGECLAAAAAHLIGPEAHETVMAEARRYAGALRERRLLLMDVPRRVVDHIAGRPAHLRLH